MTRTLAETLYAKAAAEVAAILDATSDFDGSWNGSDALDALAEWIDRHNGWHPLPCQAHGSYSANAPDCPFCSED